MRGLTPFLQFGSAVVVAIAAIGLVLAILGHSPVDTLSALLSGAFGSRFAISQTLLRTVPILLCALAALIPAEAGLVNIGGEGQLQLGAIAVAVVAALLSGASTLLLVPALLAAVVIAGGLWAAVPAILRTRFGVGEALVTLFLNYVALHLLGYLVHGPMRDPNSLGWPMGRLLPDQALIKASSGTGLHVGVLIVPIAAIVILVWMRNSRRGQELRAVGINWRAAQLVRIPVRSYQIGAMLAGGALASLAGYFEMTAVQTRLRPDMALGLGYSGFLAAWMCRRNPFLVVPFSFLIAGLVAGAESVQIMTGLPSASSDMAQGLLLLFVLLVQPLWLRFDERRAIRRAVENVR